MRIKQFAAKYKISTDTARYYEAEGLLQPIRLDNGYRLYDEACERAIKFIIVLKRAGFSLQEIKVLLSLEQRPISAQCNIASVAMFSKQIDYIQRQIAFYQSALQALQLTTELMGNGKYVENQHIIDQLLLDMYSSISNSLDPVDHSLTEREE